MSLIQCNQVSLPDSIQQVLATRGLVQAVDHKERSVRQDKLYLYAEEFDFESDSE